MAVVEVEVPVIIVKVAAVAVAEDIKAPEVAAVAVNKVDNFVKDGSVPMTTIANLLNKTNKLFAYRSRSFIDQINWLE